MDDNDRLYEAISEGVARGIFRIATNASSTPNEDFLDYIQKGVTQGIENIGYPETQGDTRHED